MENWDVKVSDGFPPGACGTYMYRDRELLREAPFTSVRTVKTRFPFVRPSVTKKRDFSQQFLGGGHMLESKHDLKL